ncbi:hypothetical protein MBM_05809 [Drepanopeziza brunnea f. sp. 'multigermtubi' MB_m1]|uniref:Uncharacterized protein n=1 Tax=Marssonina brunnea f. sp. multigermtubi (strain MB_m1) TaxID=1072389 RepID=K1X572_MARBU|nr:uncharacterized protein MBM_05809 [Drepanopeziza brunnea f. sp. 'multigermtubi' MB_m1]EKD15798.1 hypothetical protein MBM_05809 [Drepanopeziza brunnea f. sp. 'multigermtubi' MB_m1]
MARGLQKIESQQAAAARAKKGGNSILKKDKGMKYQCSKHPKLDTPTDAFASMAKAAPAPAEASKK